MQEYFLPICIQEFVIGGKISFAVAKAVVSVEACCSTVQNEVDDVETLPVSVQLLVNRSIVFHCLHTLLMIGTHTFLCESTQLSHGLNSLVITDHGLQRDRVSRNVYCLGFSWNEEKA